MSDNGVEFNNTIFLTDEPSEDNRTPSPKRMKFDSESEDLDSELDKEIETYSEQLHKAMSKNVELHNEQNKALALLRKINSQNQDLLEALLATEPDLLNLTLSAAPEVVLTADKERDFSMQTSW